MRTNRGFVKKPLQGRTDGFVVKRADTSPPQRSRGTTRPKSLSSSDIRFQPDTVRCRDTVHLAFSAGVGRLVCAAFAQFKPPFLQVANLGPECRLAGIIPNSETPCPGNRRGRSTQSPPTPVGAHPRHSYSHQPDHLPSNPFRRDQEQNQNQRQRRIPKRLADVIFRALGARRNERDE